MSQLGARFVTFCRVTIVMLCNLFHSRITVHRLAQMELRLAVEKVRKLRTEGLLSAVDSGFKLTYRLHCIINGKEIFSRQRFPPCTSTFINVRQRSSPPMGTNHEPSTLALRHLTVPSSPIQVVHVQHLNSGRYKQAVISTVIS